MKNLPVFRRNILTALMSQSLIGVASFGASLFLIHVASKEHFGLYGATYAALQLMVGCSNAAITTRMTVNFPNYDLPLRDFYCASMRRGQTIIFLSISFFVLSAVFITGRRGFFSPAAVEMGAAAALGVIFVVRHEYYRVLFYLRHKPGPVLFFEVCHVTVWGASTSIGCLLTTMEPATLAIIGYCLGSASASFLGARLARLPRPGGWRAVGRALGESWPEGRWALSGVFVVWVQNQGYTWLLAALIGASAIAEANAARLLLAPLGLIFAAVQRISLPRLASEYKDKGCESAIDLARQILYIVIIIVSVYCSLIVVLCDFIIDVLFSESYRGIGILVFLWSITYFFAAIRVNSALLLQVFRKNKVLTSATIISSATCTFLAISGIPVFGVPASVASIGVAELLLGFLLWQQVRNVQK